MGHTTNTITSAGGIDPIRDVCAVLGIASNGDITTLCSNEHGKTNKWALYKPERYDKIGELTETERMVNNRSLVVQSFSTVRAAADAVAQTEGIDWTYLTPRAGTDWQRLTDWEGYDHSTAPWMQLIIDSDGLQQIRFTGVQNIANLPAWMVAFSFMTGTSSTNCYVGFLLYKKNSSGAVSSARAYLASAIADMDDYDKQYSITHSVAGTEYGGEDVYCVPAIIRPSATPLNGVPCILSMESWETSIGTIYPLPSAPLKIHIKSPEEAVDTHYFNGFSISTSGGTAYVQGQTFYFSNVTVTVSRSSSAATAQALYVAVDMSVSTANGSQMQDKYIGSLTATLSPGQSSSVVVSDSATYIAEPPEHCSIKCEVTIAASSALINAQKQTYYVYVEL